MTMTMRRRAITASARRRSGGGGGPTAPALPALPAGMTAIYVQDFNTDAALGSFNANYGPSSGRSFKLGNYDAPAPNHSTNGITIYDSSKCSYVSGSSYFCNMHSEGSQSYASTVLPLDPANGSPAQNSYLNFTYGRVEFCVRLASYTVDPTSGSTGFKIAFLMWPGTGLWTNEVDFPETDSFSGTTTFDVQEPIRAASMVNATQHGSAGVFIANYDTGVHLTDGLYHTFTLDWPNPVDVAFATSGVFTFTSGGNPYTHGLALNDLVNFAYQSVSPTGKGIADGSGSPSNKYYVQTVVSSTQVKLAATQSAGTAITPTGAGTAQWLPAMTASIDGTVVETWHDEITLPQQPMHLALQCEGFMKKVSGSYIAPPTGTTALIEVPWVRIAQYGGGTSGALTTSTSLMTSTTLTTQG